MPPKKLKYGKAKLGESTSMQLMCIADLGKAVVDLPNWFPDLRPTMMTWLLQQLNVKDKNFLRGIDSSADQTCLRFDPSENLDNKTL